jgi:UDP-glucose 4-epimerase
MLEREEWVGSLVGIDVDPPRRRLRRADFHLVSFADRQRVVDITAEFNPHVLVHVAVWEPDARAGTSHAEALTNSATSSMLGAAAECPALEAIVLRSGIEVYGRARGSASRPTEASPLRPTSHYGRMLVQLEQTAVNVAARVGVAVAPIRLAPVLGKHVPSPLGRLLRQSVVPFSALADAPFSVVEVGDAAQAIVHAARLRAHQPVNVVADGAINTLSAILRGRRLPLPLVGPEWTLATRISHVMGAPIPDHVLELIHRGRLADNGSTREVLGVSPGHTTSDVIQQLYGWESIIRVPALRSVA